MVEKDMIAFVGTAEHTSTNGYNYYNFFADKKIIDGKVEELSEEDKKLIENYYGNINIDVYPTTDLDIKIKKRIRSFTEELERRKRFVCVFHMCKKDIEPTLSNSRYEGKKVFLYKLFSYKENDDIFHGITQVITRNKWEGYLTPEDFMNYDSERPVDIKPDMDLIEGNQYFIQFPNGSEGFKYVGPIGYQNGELKKPFKYPTDKLALVEYTAITEKHSNGIRFLYYTGEPYDFDFVSPSQNHEDIGFHINPIEEKRKELVNSIDAYRKYGNNMICNMLICIMQGFLTVFAGEPGTGKTSICDKIAQLLGASRENGADSRYLSISVERGWTSKNDLVGYFNPLSKEVVNTTGLYKALRTVNDKEDESAPYLVLLDEANLSQMEYYWSSFIKLADDDAREKTSLYIGNDNFKLPDYFKFLATINNDQTTESLSPRLLDRAWVITLPTLQELDGYNQADDDCSRISWEDFQQMFAGVSENSEIFKTAATILTDIYEKYKTYDKPVSPRSKLAIEKYLKSALACFDGENDDKIKDAIDFIILQRLLPMLGGYISDDFKDELISILKEYPESQKRFSKMCKDQDFTESSYVNFFM